MDDSTNFAQPWLIYLGRRTARRFGLARRFALQRVTAEFSMFLRTLVFHHFLVLQKCWGKQAGRQATRVSPKRDPFIEKTGEITATLVSGPENPNPPGGSSGSRGGFLVRSQAPLAKQVQRQPPSGFEHSWAPTPSKVRIVTCEAG